MTILLETRNLTKTYNNNRGIFNINIQVEQGDIYGFLGPNGSGKTTTIRTILDLIHANSGSIYIDGKNIHTQFEEAIQNVGAIVETPKFYEYLTGRANLMLMLGYYKNLPEERIDEVLRLVHLEKRALDKVKTYSLGMKQRLGIARALLHQPKVVILDEPTNGLDPQGMKEVREMIVRLSVEEDITFFISTHLLNEVEQMCNKVCILNEGQIIKQGMVKDLLIEDMETVFIHSNDEQGIDVVNSVDFVEEVEKVENGFLVRMNKGYSDKLIQLLVSNQINVLYVIPKSQSLEKYYLDIVEGGRTHD